MKISSAKMALLISAAAVAMFVAVPQMAQAQDAGSAQEQSGSHRRTPDEAVAALDSKLSLTDDQKAKIKPIIAERQERMRALADSGGRRMKKARDDKTMLPAG